MLSQIFYPYYFKKHLNDGMDYLIYMVASIIQDGSYSELYI